MSATETPEVLPSESAPTLAEIARELERLGAALAECARRGDPRTLREVQEAQAQLSQRLGELQNRGTTDEARRTARLRRAVLEALRRGGPALPIELAAVTLSLPDEIQPVLQEMERDGLIEFRNVQGGRLVNLTDRGRQE